MRARFAHLGVLVALGSGSPAQAAEPEIHYNFELSSVTAYVARGDCLSSDLLRPTFQPSGRVDVQNFGPGTVSMGLWMSSALAENAPANEIDPWVAYSVGLPAVTVDLTYTLYLMPEAPQLDAMHEFQAKATTTEDFPVQLFLGAAVDPIRTEGWYAFGGAQGSVDLGPVALDLALNVGGSEYTGLELSLQDVTLSARGTYELGESGLYVAATAAAAWSGRVEHVHPYGGLALGINR